MSEIVKQANPTLDLLKKEFLAQVGTKLVDVSIEWIKSTQKSLDELFNMQVKNIKDICKNLQDEFDVAKAIALDGNSTNEQKVKFFDRMTKINSEIQQYKIEANKFIEEQKSSKKEIAKKVGFGLSVGAGITVSAAVCWKVISEISKARGK